MKRDEPLGEDDEHMFGSLIGFSVSPTLRNIRSALKRQGLHVVSAADKAVLNAARDWFDSWGPVHDLGMLDEAERHLFTAELARRDVKP
jgi:hypothetical protein